MVDNLNFNKIFFFKTREGDTTGAGSLDSTEFMIMMARMLKQLDPRPTLQKAFEVIVSILF